MAAQVAVQSRPASQASGKLPMIQHPMSRMSHPGQMDIRGAGSRPGTQMSQSGRPLAAEQDYGRRGGGMDSRAGSRLRSRSHEQYQRAPVVMNPKDTIPEGIEYVQGDSDKTKLPIFGAKSPMVDNRDEVMSRASTRLSKASTAARLEVDEIESLIKSRCLTHYHELRKKFKDNDPEGQGNVSRDAFGRIITMLTGRPVPAHTMHNLLKRMGFSDRTLINFTDFFAKYRHVDSRGFPSWMDLKKDYLTRDNVSASQVHMLLKEKARQRVLEAADLVPQVNPDGASRLLKPEFRNALNNLNLFMEDDEFDKLWKRYDAEGFGMITGEKLMKKLGVSVDAMPKTPQTPQAEPQTVGRKREIDRQRSLDVEKWLKNKFREGFYNMRSMFEKMDKKNSGKVNSDYFLSVLAKHGLRLSRSHLDDFLARCGLEPGQTQVPYKEFLQRFQDRSEEGMPHQILSNPNHRYNRSIAGETNVSDLSALEAKMMTIFQQDFLSLVGTFHKIDRLGQDVISQEEFRAAIESKFGYEVPEGQFRNLVNKIPLDNEGNVKYAEFMAQFDARGAAPSLFGKPLPSEFAGDDESMMDVPRRVNRLVVDPTGAAEEPNRPVEEVYGLIKDLMSRSFQSFEKAWQDMEEFNSQRLSQETMYQLLRQFDIYPEINRGEIRDLWKTFITNKDNKLEYLHFIRHFGYSAKSAAFPNAKLRPPCMGDADFMIRSRKLNSDKELLHDGLRGKVEYLWEDLRREFTAMDPYQTGFVSMDEFKEILTELCVELTPREQELIIKKFKTSDSRVSYIEFLRPYAQKRQVWRHGNNMSTLLQQPRPELPMADIVEPPQKGLTGITARLRQKLSGDWKNVRRAFKKLDPSNKGLVTLPEFRNVLKLANVALTEDEVYHVMTTFDESLSGRIEYAKFLNDVFRPETNGSGK